MAQVSAPAGHLTTHSTGLAISRSFIIQVDCSPVNSSVRAKLWRRWRETGSCAALTHAGGRRLSLRASEAVLRRKVACQPDVTLSELRERIVAHGAPVVCLATLCAELQRLALPCKKSRSTTVSATVSG